MINGLFNKLDLPEEGKESNFSSDHFKFVSLSDVSCEYSLSSKPVSPFSYVYLMTILPDTRNNTKHFCIQHMINMILSLLTRLIHLNNEIDLLITFIYTLHLFTAFFLISGHPQKVSPTTSTTIICLNSCIP